MGEKRADLHPVDRARLRVATQNLWGIRGAWAERRRVLTQLVLEARPDIISFQEAIKTPTYDQARDLVGDEYEVVFQKAPEPDGQSVAIASRWPIRSVREVDLRMTSRVNCRHDDGV